MTIIKTCSIGVLIIYIFSTCKKTSLPAPSNVSSIEIVNAVVGTSSIISNFSNDPLKYFTTSQKVNFGSFFTYTLKSGETPLTVADYSDTSHTMFSGIFNLKPHAIYTLFFGGQYFKNGQSTIDTLLREESLPYHGVLDSVSGVRFVNLAIGIDAISINIKGNADGSEISGLSYKGVTEFKPYSALANQKYTFEVREATSGDLLTTFNYSNVQRFRNVSIVIKGIRDGSGSSGISAFTANNF